MDNVLKAFEEYPKEKITGIWACYFNNLRDIMSVDGGNDYKQAHNNSRNLIKTTGTPIDLRVDFEDYDRCFDLLSGVQSIDLVHSYTQLVKNFLNIS